MKMYVISREEGDTADYNMVPVVVVADKDFATKVALRMSKIVEDAFAAAKAAGKPHSVEFKSVFELAIIHLPDSDIGYDFMGYRVDEVGLLEPKK
jgi:hypothetical protein